MSQTVVDCCGVDPGQPPTPFERSGADLSVTVSPIAGNKQVIQSNCSAGAAARGDLQQAAETCIWLYGMVVPCHPVSLLLKADTDWLVCRRRLLTAEVWSLASRGRVLSSVERAFRILYHRLKAISR